MWLITHKNFYVTGDRDKRRPSLPQSSVQSALPMSAVWNRPIYSAKTETSMKWSRFEAAVCRLLHKSGTVEANDRNCETVQVQAVWLLDKHTLSAHSIWNLKLYGIKLINFTLRRRSPWMEMGVKSLRNSVRDYSQINPRWRCTF